MSWSLFLLRVWRPSFIFKKMNLYHVLEEAVLQWIFLHGPRVLGLFFLALAIFTSGHAILHKRDPRSAVGWVGLIWLSPLLGAILYYLFGINRIRKRVKSLIKQTNSHSPGSPHLERPTPPPQVPSPILSGSSLGNLESFLDKIVKKPLLPGNHILPLPTGEEAYQKMLVAIQSAQHSLSFSTYIFDNDFAGELFVDAFAEAHIRGVEIRVLIDDVGTKYSWPPIVYRLRKKKIPFARFLPTFIPWHMAYMNLRNHRKILVVDGKLGFTGGMNIRQGHLVGRVPPKKAIKDLHFQLEGPVVRHMQETFAKDWSFATKEILEGDLWFPPLLPQGSMFARGISDGPDEDFEKIRWAFLGAISQAKSSLRIMTPYFLPDHGIITALNIASLSGVNVEILLPAQNNLLLVQWATREHVKELLQKGCKIYLSPPPFDHTKLMIVDQTWVLFGSSNWDARSLRLNFEMNIECNDKELAQQLDLIFEKVLCESRELLREDLSQRPLLVRLRDGAARMLSPYL